MPEEKKDQKHLSAEEVEKLTGYVKNPGLRFTVDLYLLDYIKHCLLEGDQLSGNIQKLESVLEHLNTNPEAKKAVETLLKACNAFRANTPNTWKICVLWNGAATRRPVMARLKVVPPLKWPGYRIPDESAC